MYFSIECTYCGKRWEQSFYLKDSLKELRCPDCKDKNLKVKEKKENENDPFGYNHKEKKRVNKT